MEALATQLETIYMCVCARDVAMAIAINVNSLKQCLECVLSVPYGTIRQPIWCGRIPGFHQFRFNEFKLGAIRISQVERLVSFKNQFRF